MSATLSVRVTPRASADAIGALEDGVLRVRLRAPPVDGRANDALCRLLAERFGVPPSAIAVVSGAGARTKRLRIDGLSDAEVAERLGAPSPAQGEASS